MSEQEIEALDCPGCGVPEGCNCKGDCPDMAARIAETSVPTRWDKGPPITAAPGLAEAPAMSIADRVRYQLATYNPTLAAESLGIYVKSVSTSKWLRGETDPSHVPPAGCHCGHFMKCEACTASTAARRAALGKRDRER